MSALSPHFFGSEWRRKAIQKIMDFYDNYISACCMRKLYDEYGNVRKAVDLELKGLVRNAMIQKINAFEVEIK